MKPIYLLLMLSLAACGGSRKEEASSEAMMDQTTNTKDYAMATESAKLEESEPH